MDRGYDQREMMYVTVDKIPRVAFRMSGTLLISGTISCPLLVCFLAMIVADWRYYTTYILPYCDEWSLVPAISMALLHFHQGFILQSLAAVHIMPRILVACLYYNHYMSYRVAFQKIYNVLVTVISVVHVLESLAFLVMCLVYTYDNFSLHSLGLGTFWVCSTVYMWLTLVVFTWSRCSTSWSRKDKLSFQRKFMLAIINAVALFLTRKNILNTGWFCNMDHMAKFPMVKRQDAYIMSEYAVLLTNFLFHATSLHEFHEGELVFCDGPVRYAS